MTFSTPDVTQVSLRTEDGFSSQESITDHMQEHTTEQRLRAAKTSRHYPESCQQTIVSMSVMTHVFDAVLCHCKSSVG